MVVVVHLEGVLDRAHGAHGGLEIVSMAWFLDVSSSYRSRFLRYMARTALHLHLLLVAVHDRRSFLLLGLPKGLRMDALATFRSDLHARAPSWRSSSRPLSASYRSKDARGSGGRTACLQVHIPSHSKLGET